jgi:hypothetical protein
MRIPSERSRVSSSAARLARVPLVIVEDRAGYDAVVDEIVGAGWTVRAASGTATATGNVIAMTVADRTDAQASVLLAIGGAGLLVRAQAERSLVDDLVEDLERIGPVLLVDGATAIRLDPDTWRLVHALADGSTVSVVARAMHMSVRTANRRITDAKEALSAPTRAQLLRSLAATDRVPRARFNR